MLKEVGKEGPDRVRGLLRKLADQWIARDLLRAKDLRGTERLEGAKEILAERGFMPALESTREGYILREHNCPAMAAPGGSSVTLVKVTQVEDVLPGTGRVVQAGGKVLALFNLNGTFYALDNRCTHVGGPLGEGRAEANVVTCPWHGSRFDVTNGQVLGPPARRPVATYVVRVEGRDVFVELP